MLGLDDAAATVRTWLGVRRPQVAIVLGSGLGALTEDLQEAGALPFASIPGFPVALVEGHRGAFVAGLLAGRPVICQSGRIHGYEGHSTDEVVLPVRVMLAAGVRTLLVTNAAGGIAPGARPGCLLLIGDQINLSGRNPLFGAAPGRPDLSDPFDPTLRALARDVGQREGIALGEGVYAGVPGPSYETPAEIWMLRGMGADMVGMSTVGEILVARAAGARCLGISVITNRAAGLSPRRLSHQEVVAAARGAATALRRLVRGIVAGLPG